MLPIEAAESVPLFAAAPPTSNLGWHVFRNTAAQVVGRNLIGLGRLAIAAVIVRGFGKGVFGQYSLLFAMLSIAEWVLDFGSTEVFVRDICRSPERSPRLLRVLTATKIAQIPVAYAVLAGALFALRYPPQTIEAGLVGGAGLLFFAGVLIYRVIFKASLAMERDVAADFVATLLMIPMVLLVAHRGWGLTALLACQALSRAAYSALCFVFGRKRFQPTYQGVTWADVRESWQSSAAIGIIGLVAVVNETVDILLLARRGTFVDLAYYSGALRFTMPLMVALSSIGATLYPVAGSYWPKARQQFEQACQRGFDSALAIAGLAICAMLAGPEFFMSLLGHTLVEGAPVLRILAVLCFAKAVSAAMGPVLYLVGAQKQALQVIVVSVTAKALAVAYAAPRFGYMGVAYAALAAELCFTAIPAIWLIQRKAGITLRWAPAIKIILLTAGCAAAARVLLPSHPLLAAMAGPVLYAPFLFLSGAAKISDVQFLLKRKAA